MLGQNGLQALLDGLLRVKAHRAQRPFSCQRSICGNQVIGSLSEQRVRLVSRPLHTE